MNKKFIALNRCYQKDGLKYLVEGFTKITNLQNETDKMVMITCYDNKFEREYVRFKDFHKKFFPLKIHVHERIYEVIMGRITNVFIAKTIKDGVVSYVSKNGKETLLTTKDCILSDCTMEVITPIKNSDIATYVYNSAAVEIFVKNLRKLDDIEKLYKDQIKKISDYRSKAGELDSRKLKYYYNNVRFLIKDFNKKTFGNVQR